MIPFIRPSMATMALMTAMGLTLTSLPFWRAAHAAAAQAQAAPAQAAQGQTTPRREPGANCLPTGDGYFRARVAGDLEARIDWPNSGTRCQGESRHNPAGVRLSFQRGGGGKPDYLFVFGITGVREGQPAHAAGANLTLIEQGTPKIFGTLGDSRCTVDTLSQRPLEAKGTYRLEARGFCTQPAHAVRGNGSVLVSTFEFAGLVNYLDDTEPPTSAPAPAPIHAPTPTPAPISSPTPMAP